MNSVNISWTLMDVVCSTTAVLQMSAGCELWKGCARWLRDITVIGTTDENGTMLEFASILRDGSLLCRLANILIPNSIDVKDIIKTKQLSQFTCTKNISNFLDFCRTKFKLKEDDLFTPGDLFYMTGFQKCLNTLSILSNTEEAISKNVLPFPDDPETSEQSTSSARSPQEIEDEDIYQTLTDNIENVDPDQTIYGRIASGDPDEHHNEQLYDHIVMVRKNSMNENDSSPMSKRNRCIMELYDTEKNYVENALRKIIQKFYEPLRGIIPNDPYKVIFGNIESIMTLHQLILDDLRYAVSLTFGNSECPSRPNSLIIQDQPKYIGEVFVKHRDGLLEYGQYCSNLMASRETCNLLMETDDFIKKNILECTKFENNQFSMQDLLTVPFQRITKYSLLIKELIKKTDLNSPDRTSLLDAQDILDDVCLYINDMTRDTEMQKFISEVEKSFVDLAMPTGVRLKDYGRVNFDGEVKMTESTLTQVGKQKPRYVFIFDKVLVICKASNKNTSFTYKNAFVISELEADNNITIDTRSSGTITRRVQHVIHLHREKTESNEVVHITLYFKNEASRLKWLNSFKLSKENGSPTELIKDTNHKVTFTNFKVNVEKPETCSVCNKLMKGLYYQGYKCDHCHMTMHKGCLALKRCEASRRTSETRSSQSFNRQRFTNGEIVTATSSFTPSDLSFLQFRKDDKIEILQIHVNGRFTGCLVNNRSRTGLVNVDRVIRARTNSMVGISPLDSPAGSIFPRLERKDSTLLPERQDSFLSNGSAFTAPRASRVSVNGTSSNRPQDYVNTEITEYAWYMGEMERKSAETTLLGTPNGTFLVRYSRNRNKYAISVSFKGEVKHMIIEQNEDRKVYLDEGYIFNSVVELVQYYREHNLIEIFQLLDTTLKNPYLQCKVYTAIHDYDAPQPGGKFLSLRKGDLVYLVDTVGEDRGWWKGQVNDMTGFFPLSYVQPLNESESREDNSN